MEGNAVDIFGGGTELSRSDIYEARVLTKYGNKILIKVAATSGILSGQYDEDIKAYIGDKCIRDAIETATNAVDESPDRAKNVKHILLDFPADLGLSADVLATVEFEFAPSSLHLLGIHFANADFEKWWSRRLSWNVGLLCEWCHAVSMVGRECRMLM